MLQLPPVSRPTRLLSESKSLALERDLISGERESHKTDCLLNDNFTDL